MKAWVDDHKYIIFMILFVFFVTSSSFWYEDSFASWILQLVMLAVIYMMVNLLPLHKKVLKAFDVWLLLAAVVKTWEFLYYTTPSQVAANAVMFVVYLLLIVHILRDIYIHKNVNEEIIVAAMCVYILIGVLFGNIYIQMDHHLRDAFDFSRVEVSQPYQRQFNIFYYSFTTLTTVGFGDIVPKNLAVKGVTIIEQMSGVLYLAVLVSRLIASFTTRKYKIEG